MLYAVFSVLYNIYCAGPLLEAVQKSHIFKDSKHFVDMALKKDPVLTLRNFHELNSAVTGLSRDKELLRQFVEEHFEDPGSELMQCSPEDWESSPLSFKAIADYRYRRWALNLHKLWKVLCRRVKPVVDERQDHYSLLYVPHPFIIPGGRFREFYYWDSYWIVKGLLFSEMHFTAQGIIKNLIYMVDQHGFVPNGGRVYYMQRSHPPLLIPMVYEYFLATGDIEFLNEALPSLEKEYYFWLLNRGAFLDDTDSDAPSEYPYFQYKAELKIPRPESYREDLELVHNITSLAERERVLSNIASAAETGWDFSTRWFAHQGEGRLRFQSIRTWSIVPVDLNAFMCMNSRIMADLYEIAGNFDKVMEYQGRFLQLKRALKRIHWNETDGIWYDYDLESKSHIRQYYISNTLPLFAKCFNLDRTPRRVYQYLKRVGALNSTKGVPTSIIDSGQQWDSSNSWPPMVHMLIEGLRTSGDPDMTEAAKEMAHNWLRNNYHTFIHTHAMYEKYNVSDNSYEGPSVGSGGEYEVQIGFGWTNGVIMDLLSTYGDYATAVSSSATSQMYTVLSWMFQVFICLWVLR